MKTERAVHDPGTRALAGNTKRASNRQQKQPHEHQLWTPQQAHPGIVDRLLRTAALVLQGVAQQMRLLCFLKMKEMVMPSGKLDAAGSVPATRYDLESLFVVWVHLPAAEERDSKP